jgi:two-component system response regulator VicR
MIVDDEPGAREVLKELLKRFGYKNLTEAYDGDEALHKLETLIPDLLILDMRMPKKSGYEIIGILKKDARTKDVPILIVSGYEVEIDRLKEYAKEKPLPILEKPLNINRLKSSVESLL